MILASIITQNANLGLGERLLSRTDGNRTDDGTWSPRSHDRYMGTSSYNKPLPLPRWITTSGDGVRSYTGANNDVVGLGGGNNLVDGEPNIRSSKPLAEDLWRERDDEDAFSRLAWRVSDVSVFANSTRSRVPSTWWPSKAWTHFDASLLFRNSTKANPEGLRESQTSCKRPKRRNSSSTWFFVTLARFPINSLLGKRLGPVFLCYTYSKYSKVVIDYVKATASLSLCRATSMDPLKLHRYLSKFGFISQRQLYRQL